MTTPARMGSDGGGNHGALSAAAMRANQVKIAAVVLSYFVISISMVFVNKVLISGDKATSIQAPIFMTWFQCVVTVGICWAFGELGRRSSPDSFFKQFPTFTYNLATARKLLPLSVIFVGMMMHITFNNLCLQYVEVSFYNVARSLTIVFNVGFTYAMLGEATSRTTLLCLGMVIVGFFVGSGGEVNFSLVGTLFGVASSVFVSLNSIWTKKAMPLVEGNQWSLAAYNNMNAVLMFLPIIALTEWGVLSENLHVMATGWYWTLMWTAGVFGFMIGIVTIMQIKLTSPLTHNISGTAKACVQTVLALMIWQNPTTPANLAGIALVLGGSFLYAYVRNREMEAANARKLAAKASAVAPAPSATSAAGGEGNGATASSQGAEEGEGPDAEQDTVTLLQERKSGAESLGGKA